VQSESVRSAALIAMPDSMGTEIATARHRRMSERPDEPVLQFLEKNLITRLESEFFYL
jgi:hypothetical protein